MGGKPDRAPTAQEQQDRRLDVALELTFPASDPVAIWLDRAEHESTTPREG
jgi:hypothetical protein